MQTLTLTRPDDWHLHLRDGAALANVLPDTARRFGRAIIMPNLRPPVTTTALAAAYRSRILAALPAGLAFEPLMTLYLTDNTSAEEIATARASGFVHGVKLYPAGATTNSDSGVSSLKKCHAALAAMEKHGLPLLVHAEVTDADVDVFDREKVFIDRHMVPLLKDFPQLKIVFEHITTRDAAQFVSHAPAHVGATITAHHLLMNRNAMFAGGIRPHHYCLPVLKREEHRLALVAAAISGSPKFFLGTDSAPHARSAKEAACGCAGMYTAPSFRYSRGRCRCWLTLKQSSWSAMGGGKELIRCVSGRWLRIWSGLVSGRQIWPTCSGDPTTIDYAKWMFFLSE